MLKKFLHTNDFDALVGLYLLESSIIVTLVNSVGDNTWFISIKYNKKGNK